MAGGGPVLEIYKGIKIRQCNVVVLKFSAAKYKYLILESERTGLPMSKILAYSSRPCERCTQIEVVAFNKEGDEVKIKRGILSSIMSQNSGTSIIQQASEIKRRNGH
jgi:hypothetical protein